MRADSLDSLEPQSQPKSLADRMHDKKSSELEGGSMPRARPDRQLERRTSAGNGADPASLSRWDHKPDHDEQSGSSRTGENRNRSPPPEQGDLRRQRRPSNGDSRAFSSSYVPRNSDQGLRVDRGDRDGPSENQYHSGDRGGDRGHYRDPPRERQRVPRSRSRSRSRTPERTSKHRRTSRNERSDAEDDDRRRHRKSQGSGGPRRGEPEPHTRKSSHSNATRPRSGSDADAARDPKRQRRSASPPGRRPGAVMPPKLPSRSPLSPVSSQGTPERKPKLDDGTPPPRAEPVARRTSNASQDVKPELKPHIKPSRSSTSGRPRSRSPSRDDRYGSSNRRDDKGHRRDRRDETKQERDDRHAREDREHRERHDRRDYHRGSALDTYRPPLDQLHSRQRSRSPRRPSNAFDNRGQFRDASRQPEYRQGLYDGQELNYGGSKNSNDLYGDRPYPGRPLDLPPLSTKLPDKDERGEVKFALVRPPPAGPAVAATAPARDLDGMLGAKPQPPQSDTPPRPNTHTRGPQGISASYSSAPNAVPFGAPPPLGPIGPRNQAERERERPAPVPIQAPHAPPHPTISAEGSQVPSRTTTPRTSHGVPAPAVPSAPRSMVATTRRSQSSGGRSGPMGALFLEKVTPLPTGEYNKIYATIEDKAPKPHVYVGSSPVSAYNLAEKLGEGTFGVVWKATRKADDAGKAKKGAVVALKEIILHNEGDGVSSARGRAACLR